MSFAEPLPFQIPVLARKERDAIDSFEGCAILSGLAEEGLLLSETDEISILEMDRNVALIRITLHCSWAFGKPSIFYGVAHDRLPFPILFRRTSDAYAYFKIEIARDRAPVVPCP